mgnify:CR=1 FL=1
MLSWNKYTGLGMFWLRAFIFSVGFVVVNCNADEAGDKSENLARPWVDKWGEIFWERFHDNLEAWYPGGRTNSFHNLYIEQALKRIPDAPWEDWEISNQDYTFTGDWFAAEWFYKAVHPSTGKVQLEATLVFGRIQDGELIRLYEYFDDMVGRYQFIGAMRLYDRTDEDPFPWPRGTALSRAYRP